MRKFSRKFSKTLAKELREELRILVSKLNLYEQNLKCFKTQTWCQNKKQMRLLEYGEKPSRFLLNLEKYRFVQN